MRFFVPTFGAIVVPTLYFYCAYIFTINLVPTMYIRCAYMVLRGFCAYNQKLIEIIVTLINF
jgi:hypothetical protein